MFPIIKNLVRLRWLRFAVILCGYSGCLAACLWFSYALRFDFHVPAEYRESLAQILPWALAVQLFSLYWFGQFRDSLSYFSTPDFALIFYACASSLLVMLGATFFFGVAHAPPRSVALTNFLLSCMALCGARGGLRFFRERVLAPQTRPSREWRRVAIIGAGDAGAALARELLSHRWLGLQPIAFLDDHRAIGSRVHRIPVWGKTESVLDPKIALKLDEAIIAMPSVDSARRREIVALLQKAGLPFRTIPSMIELAMGSGEISQLRPVQIEDLLGRDEVKIDTAHIGEVLAGRVVMVTGAGGSIGSELCRQIASFAPASLLLLERAEAALFTIEQELLERGFHHLVVPLVADVTDFGRMADLFQRHRPEIVFHAAAHKHVPMMESQPAEAIRNNVFGTAQLAELAAAFEVERFLLISTDKAINPTSVMGATKRMAEITVQAMQARPGTRTKFMAVRFGNVLGSSGSVVPIFQKQIAAGGPVKVTHPEVTRFFMTIPEAVSLVLQSGISGGGGEIFVLDMGEPVKIVDLARQMIELSRQTAGAEIQIEFTGLRTGEKLYEELNHHGEDVTATPHLHIRRLVGAPQAFATVKAQLSDLASVVAHLPNAELKLWLKKLIPEYTPALERQPSPCQSQAPDLPVEASETDASEAIFWPPLRATSPAGIPGQSVPVRD